MPTAKWQGRELPRIGDSYRIGTTASMPQQTQGGRGAGWRFASMNNGALRSTNNEQRTTDNGVLTGFHRASPGLFTLRFSEQ